MIKVCKFCSQEFTTKDGRKKFCNRSCSSSFNGAAFPKRKAAIKICPRCNLVKPMRKNATYCGKECARPNKVDLWLKGEWDGTTKVGLSSCIRNYLLDKSNYRCESLSCSTPGGWSGINPVSGKSCLTIDHINGLWYDNRQENLKVLCPNCHSMTPNYGALNKGNGRTNRYLGDVA